MHICKNLVQEDRHADERLMWAEFAKAKELLGPDKIIGVTASSIDEAVKACEAGADYLGIGTVYSTQT